MGRGGVELIIFVDMDEVLAQFIKPLINEYNRRYSSDITIEDITQWELPKDMYAIFHEDNFFINLLPYAGSKNGMKHLKDKGHDVVIASNPSHNSYIAAQKMEWLEMHFSGFPLILTERKDLLCGDLMIDDGAHHLETFEGWKIVMDRPWNKHYNRATFRVINWSGIIQAVNMLENR